VEACEHVSNRKDVFATARSPEVFASLANAGERARGLPTLSMVQSIARAWKHRSDGEVYDQLEWLSLYCFALDEQLGGREVTGENLERRKEFDSNLNALQFEVHMRELPPQRPVQVSSTGVENLLPAGSIVGKAFRKTVASHSGLEAGSIDGLPMSSIPRVLPYATRVSPQAMDLHQSGDQSTIVRDSTRKTVAVGRSYCADFPRLGLVLHSPGQGSRNTQSVTSRLTAQNHRIGCPHGCVDRIPGLGLCRGSGYNAPRYLNCCADCPVRFCDQCDRRNAST
jgi:hypothetical protein